MNNGSVNKKRLVIRLVLLALLVALCFFLYYYGKEHEVLLDNKTVEINGQSYEAAEFVRITVNGDAKNKIELYAKERDVVKVNGPNHTIKVEIIDEDSDKVIKTEERDFNFGKTSSFMISVPAVAEKAPDVYLPLPGSMVQAPAPETEPEAATETTGEIEPPALSD
ncbi:MAG: hypothetical protein AGIKBDMD_01912 [Synergistaceae bacterium]|nr:hypothetical protein [Synergistaceae bacterium]